MASKVEVEMPESSQVEGSVRCHWVLNSSVPVLPSCAGRLEVLLLLTVDCSLNPVLKSGYFTHQVFSLSFPLSFTT